MRPDICEVSRPFLLLRCLLVASKEGINIRGKGGQGVKLNRLRMGGWYSNAANGNSCQNPSQPSTMFIDDVAVGSDYIGP